MLTAALKGSILQHLVIIVYGEMCIRDRVEPVLIRKKFLKWQDAHPEFPRIVFHGLRHSSATYQLMISGDVYKRQSSNLPALLFCLDNEI